MEEKKNNSDAYELHELTLDNKKKLNSRKKGNTFELKIAKLFNEKFNTKEFCRSPGSGAFATTHSLPDYLKIYGDLIAPEKFKFIIECKKGYSKESFDSLLNPNSLINSFIEQAERDAKKAKKSTLLLISQNRRPIISIVQRNITKQIILTNNYILTPEYLITYFDILLGLPRSFFFKE